MNTCTPAKHEDVDKDPTFDGRPSTAIPKCTYYTFLRLLLIPYFRLDLLGLRRNIRPQDHTGNL